ncbi:MAG: alpha/beta hydrolase [Rhodospirillaceae bacterium]|nr:alpha/beta hydrolase [Rhodospirillaceae bacterium]
MTPAPYTSRFYTSPDGLKLHYRDYAGPAHAPLTVLCIPGLTRNARDFEDLAPHLAKKYRVLVAELRGRGLSEYAKDPYTYVPPVYVRDIAALLDFAGLTRVALIGTSLGGIVSMILAAVMPARLLGVVINDVGPDIDPEGVARIASYLGKNKPVSNWDEAAAAIKELDGKIYPEYTPADWARMGKRRYVEAPDGSFRIDYDANLAKPFMNAVKNADLWPFFSRLRELPTLAIRGAASDLLKPDTFVRMKAVVPNLTQVVVPNRGHAPYLDEPEALTAIDVFLSEVPRSLGPLTVAARTVASGLFLAKLKIQGVI